MFRGAQKIEMLRRKIFADYADQSNGRKQRSGGGSVSRGAAERIIDAARRRLDRIKRDGTDNQNRVLG